MVDAGFTCPTRDGTLSEGGCLFCDLCGSGGGDTFRGMTVTEQVSSQIEKALQKKSHQKFIVYFQAFTNTYESPERLKQIYDEALCHPDIVGLAVGTRPDCLPEETLNLLHDYNKRLDVWMELGIQSIHVQSLRYLKRRHDFTSGVNAINRCHELGLKTCAHVILGIPNETPEMMAETALELSRLGVDAVKIHNLYVSKRTQLEVLYQQKKVKILSLEEYIPILLNFLKHLDPEIIIQRLFGEAHRNLHVAPDWTKDKNRSLDLIRREMVRLDFRQGSMWKNKRFC